MIHKINKKYKKSRRFTTKRTLRRNKSRVGGEIKNSCARIFIPCNEFIFEHNGQIYKIKQKNSFSKSTYSLFANMARTIESTDIETFISKLKDLEEHKPIVNLPKM